jgi:hypothetical protein
MNLELVAYQSGDPYATFPQEPAPKSWLLQALLMDADGQEDFYLAELARAEAGEVIDNLYNNLVHVYPQRDVVFIEDMSEYSFEEPEAQGPRIGTTLSMTEAKQLILDWLEAKRRWVEERSRGGEPRGSEPPSDR